MRRHRKRDKNKQQKSELFSTNALPATCTLGCATKEILPTSRYLQRGLPGSALSNILWWKTSAMCRLSDASIEPRAESLPSYSNNSRLSFGVWLMNPSYSGESRQSRSEIVQLLVHPEHRMAIVTNNTQVLQLLCRNEFALRARQIGQAQKPHGNCKPQRVRCLNPLIPIRSVFRLQRRTHPRVINVRKGRDTLPM